jgi:sensor histidine kinase regulating citrate/malate metabolism
LRSRRHLTLAGQFLLLQLAVLLVVVVVTSIVSLRQSDADFRGSRATRLGAAAESLANTAVVQDALRRGGGRRALAFYTQQRGNDVGASAVYLASTDGEVLVSTDPTRVGETVDLGTGDAAHGRAWTGDIDDRGDRAIAAEVPVYAGGVARAGNRRPPEVVGIAVVTERYPALTERLAQARADVLAVLATGLAVGALGSWLLSRLIRRRTRGLEPAQIAALADQREALLTSIREGVVAVSDEDVVTVLSGSARDLLGLPEEATGRRLGELGLEPRVEAMLRGGDEVRDAVLVVGGRVLVLNGNRVVHDGHPSGTVTTLRDRTELLAMQSELSARESITETLRAQTHEFSNQLHTISGLIQLGEYDEAGRFVHGVSSRRAEISDVVTARVDDPAVAALLIAKASLAAERRVLLEISPDGFLPRLDPDLSADVGTVLGNLVDNAVDAAADAADGTGGARVDVRLDLDGSVSAPTVVVQVADSGPGVPAESIPEIFRRGFSTKPADASGRGVGLALVQVVCEGRGGSVSVHNAVGDGRGAVFTARLPTGTWTQQPQTGPA